MRFFYHFGANFCSCALGINFICDPDVEYAVAFLFGPFLLLIGWERPEKDPYLFWPSKEAA